MKMRRKISSLIDILNFIFGCTSQPVWDLSPLPGTESALCTFTRVLTTATKKVQEILNLRETLMCLMLVMIFRDYVRNRMEVVSYIHF